MARFPTVSLSQHHPGTRAMTPSQSTNPDAPSTDSFRWDQPTVILAYDHFQNPDPCSQRQYARDHDIPRSTLGAWLRHHDGADPDVEPEVFAFFRSGPGQRFLRRLVLALFVVFLFGAACGLRRLALFLRRTRLDRFVAPSQGALHDLAQEIQDNLGTFADEERPRLAEGMPHRHIAVIADENFHGGHVCLVAAEPVSNFLLVEEYADHRDAKTWTEAIKKGI